MTSIDNFVKDFFIESGLESERYTGLGSSNVALLYVAKPFVWVSFIESPDGVRVKYSMNLDNCHYALRASLQQISEAIANNHGWKFFPYGGHFMPSQGLTLEATVPLANAGKAGQLVKLVNDMIAAAVTGIAEPIGTIGINAAAAVPAAPTK